MENHWKLGKSVETTLKNHGKDIKKLAKLAS
jgi:hypothetical protein